VNTLQELGEGKGGRNWKREAMRLTKWRVIASAVFLTVLMTGCSYVPHSSTVWTPERAKAAIIKQEAYNAIHVNGVTPESLTATDEYFDNCYLSDIYSRWINGRQVTTRRYDTRRIYFRDIETVYVRWEAWRGILGTPFFFAGLRGPYVYERRIVLNSGEELELMGPPKWEMLNWFWLWVIPVRPFLHSDPYTEAILYMSSRAREAGEEGPSTLETSNRQEAETSRARASGKSDTLQRE